MNHGLGSAGAILEIGEQAFGRHDLGDLVLGEVAPLVVALEVIADHDLVRAARAQGSGDVRADEAGPAGDDDHGLSAGAP